MESILSKFKASDLKADPFPYLVIKQAIEPEVYERLVAEYPFESEIRGYSGFGNNMRYQISASEGLRENRLSPLWREFVHRHTRQEFYLEVRKIFKDAIQKFYPNLSANPKTGVRFLDPHAEFFLDCQPGINSPVVMESSVKGPHLDHPSELFAGLLYLRDPNDKSEGGSLDVYRLKKTNPVFAERRFINPAWVEKAASIPYEANTFVLFLNTPISIHGVTDRTATTFTRRLCNFVGEMPTTNPLFDIEYKRKSFFKAASRRLGRKLLELSQD